MSCEATITPANNDDALSELQSAHENLLAWMWALDDLTRQPTPRRGQLETVRWFLSKARRDRRLALEAVSAGLTKLSPAEAEAVKDSRTLTYDAMAAGSRHIAKWTLGAIEADWAGYGSETSNMRDLWIKAIEAEKQALYPLIAKQN